MNLKHDGTSQKYSKFLRKAYISLQRESTHVGGLDAQCENFMLGIPICWYLKLLCTQRNSPPSLSEPPCTQRELPCTQRELAHTQHEPQLKLMEYSLCWGFTLEICVGHVHFMLFVSTLFAFDSQRERVF